MDKKELKRTLARKREELTNYNHPQEKSNKHWIYWQLASQLAKQETTDVYGFMVEPKKDYFVMDISLFPSEN